MKIKVEAIRDEDSDKCYVYKSSFAEGSFAMLAKVWIPRHEVEGAPPKSIIVTIDL